VPDDAGFGKTCPLPRGQLQFQDVHHAARTEFCGDERERVLPIALVAKENRNRKGFLLVMQIGRDLGSRRGNAELLVCEELRGPVMYLLFRVLTIATKVERTKLSF